MTTFPLKGMLTQEALQAKIHSGEIETILAVFPDLYGRLIGKRITGDFFLDQTADGGMHVCDYLLTVDMEMDVIEGYPFANWAKGYGDIHCVPDFATLRQITWLDRSALVVCDLQTDGDHQAIPIAPRTLLKNQIEQLAALGYAAKGGSELEYFLFKDSYESAREKNTKTSKRSAGISKITICSRAQKKRVSTPVSAVIWAKAVSPSSSARANGARASTSSTCATPTCWKWPTATRYTNKVSKKSLGVWA